jgi:hypothetical protein
VIADSVRTLLSIDPGVPWFIVTRQIQRMNTRLMGRQGRREINKVIGLMVERGEIRRNGSRLHLTTIEDRKQEESQE